MRKGDKSVDGKYEIVDEDRLCYKVKMPKGKYAIADKACYLEFVEYAAQHPDENAQTMKDMLSGKSDIDPFAYGYNSLFRNLALMTLDDKLVIRQTSVQEPHSLQSTTTLTPSSHYRPYLTAIRTKPFLLLAGISGTGKSRIVRELARACWQQDSAEYKAHKPKNFEMIQVKPNWHDSSELVGYESRVNGEKYVVGPFLKFIVKAMQEPDVPYFLCLDEMNLAPVEQYFAEYLSVIESRKLQEDGSILTDPIVDYEPTVAYKSLIDQLFPEDNNMRGLYLTEDEKTGRRLTIPQNLIVVGTVNMDETTFSFSRKVLDRAMTIEMNEVNLHGGLEDEHENIGYIKQGMILADAVEGKDVYGANKEVCDDVLNYLEEVNNHLNGTPFKIAYRTRNEFLLYVVNNLPYAEKGKEKTAIARALDEVTSMKILSRIEGDDSKVSKNLLDGLIGTIEQQLKAIAAAFKTDDSISIKKLEEMKKRLDAGYTSFWS